MSDLKRAFKDFLIKEATQSKIIGGAQYSYCRRFEDTYYPDKGYTSHKDVYIQLDSNDFIGPA